MFPTNLNDKKEKLVKKMSYVIYLLVREDKLYIHDGDSERSPTIQGTGGYLTGTLGSQGNDKPRTYVSSGQDIFLKFTSDRLNNHPGFLIEYNQGKFVRYFYLFAI